MKRATELSRFWRTALIDSVLVFVMTAALIWPLFKLKYMDRWGSIESTFIADARFLRDHWPRPLWQPLWYGGTRFDYIYPPALRYGTAAITKVYPAVIPAHAYHLYTAFFYCAGISGVYLFIRVARGSRGLAWLGAAAAALLSPSFLFLRAIRVDSGYLVPQRLGVLARYGEGPHISALALLPIVLAAALRALEDRKPVALAAAAVSGALLVSNNFYGATALAISFPILVWSVWITHQDRRIWFRAAAIVLLTFGLTAFWLTPSYLAITIRNLKFVSNAGNRWSLWVTLVVATAFLTITGRFRGRRHLAYPIFVCGNALFFSLFVLGHFALAFRVIGEPGRMVPELDLALILVALEGIGWLWWSAGARLDWLRRKRWIPRAVAVAVVLISFNISRHFVRHAWTLYPRAPDFQNRIEYRLTEWIAKNLPDQRTFAAGSLRFWYDTWHDLAQVGGGSEQGLLNEVVEPAQWQVLWGDGAEIAIRWLQCLGVDSVVVHDKRSQEYYHDFVYPQKFAGVLPVLYDNKQGDVIYKVPRRFAGLARVVETKRFESLRPMRSDADLEDLRAYSEAVENGPDSPATSAWEGTDAMGVHARLSNGEALLVQVSYDPAWHAYSGERPLPIRRDLLGQILIQAPPGEHDIRLVFELPLENRIGWAISLISAAIVVALLVSGHPHFVRPRI